MPIFKPTPAPVAEEKWIPYRENGQVKYMRAADAGDVSATGGSSRHSKPSAWGNMVAPVGFVAQAPQLLQERYTDDSLIAAIITGVVPAENPKGEDVVKKKSFMSKFRKEKEPNGVKVVWMPRREYKKFFAKDGEGKYIGTEKQREWAEEELEEKFGEYQKGK